MKQVVAIFIFLGILLQTYNKAVAVAQYIANQDYIAKNLCVNKAKPKMHCNGKCHLKKQMEQQEAPSSNGSSKDKQEVITLFCADEKVNITHNDLITASPEYFTYNEAAHSLYTASVFHPPAV